jgi:hypothetical protein
MTCKSAEIQTPERTAILQWVARIGAVTDQALAAHAGTTVASARARLLAAGRAGLLARHRPLTGQPSLYTVTRSGMRAAGLGGLDPCRVSSSNALHLIESARIAAALESCYADYRVLGERELRRDERECGRPLASARLREGLGGGPPLHRPDLVLWPRHSNGELPVAVEVELTIKAPRRLLEICRAWARCRCVVGVLYLAPHEVQRALARAIERAQAEERIAVVPLDTLPTSNGGSPLEVDP